MAFLLLAVLFLPFCVSPCVASGVGMRLPHCSMKEAMTAQGTSTATVRPADTHDSVINGHCSSPRLNPRVRDIQVLACKILSQLNTPFFLIGSGTATGAMLQSQETVRRCLYFWSSAGPIVAHYRLTQFWMDHITKPEKSHRNAVYERLHDRYSQPSLRIVLHLKGLYVKLAQVLSVRPDFIPHQYIELFSTVQDSVPQWPYENVDTLLRQSLRNDLGLHWEDVFEHMDHDALGSASIGQCHRAILKPHWEKSPHYEGGKVVAVKVMHPGAEKRFYNDFQVFRWLCRIALPGWRPILDELNRQFMTEFDYLNEANNLDEVRTNMAKSPFSNLVSVPQPFFPLCTKHILVMEMQDGKKLSDDIEDRLASALGGNKHAARDFLTKKRNAFLLEGNTGSLDNAPTVPIGTSFLHRAIMSFQLLSLFRHVRRCVDILVDVHGYQILRDGTFNGDPHGGNLLQLKNGKLGLIDYGQTRRLNENERLAISRIVVELSKKPTDEHKVGEAMRSFGFKTKFSRDDVMVKYARLFFDNDAEGKALGCATPQLYLLKLSMMDPLQDVPDAAVFVARASYMFRGMGSMFNEQICTAHRWANHALAAISASNAVHKKDG